MHSANAVTFDGAGYLMGDMFDERSHQVGRGDVGIGKEGQEMGYKPFLAKRFGQREAVVGEGVEGGKECGVDVAAAGDCATGVIFFVHQSGHMVERHVARAYVKSHAGLVVVVVGDVGEAAEVEAGVVVAEEDLVADGDEWGALSSEGDVEGAEIVNHREASLGSDGVAVAYLGSECEVGLVENGVTVGGYGVAGTGVFVAEAVDKAAEEVSEFDVGKGVFIGGGLLERREDAYPFAGERVGLGGKEVESSVVDLAVSDVESVERGARH